MTVQNALASIRQELNNSYFERGETIDGLLLALLSGQHAFVLGPPGTAKSQVIRDLVSRLDGASYFESLLSRTRPPEAILGPFDLPRLRDHGDLTRKVTGFLPTADIAFLDEIGKMGATLGHDLLSILNERLYHEVNGGRSAKNVPLSSAFTASNEMIVDESDDSAALWDRLLVRVVVDYIQGGSEFAALLAGAVTTSASGAPTTVPWEDVKRAVTTEVPGITVPTDVIETIIRLRASLKNDGIRPSDRRWRQGIRILQAHAFMNGRSEVNDDDVQSLSYILWDTLEERDKVRRATTTISNPVNEECLNIQDACKEFMQQIAARKDKAAAERNNYAVEVNMKIKASTARLQTLRQEALQQGRSTTVLDQTIEKVGGVKEALLAMLQARPMQQQ